MNWRRFFGRTTRLDLLAVILGLVLVLVLLASCSPMRVAPVGTVTPDPTGGGWTMNRDLPQPVAEDYQPGAALGWLQVVGSVLPSPWREVALMLVSTLAAKRVAEAPWRKALQQTVNGLELAKNDHPDAVPALHMRLGETQDERTKRLVWDLRP